MAGLKDKRGFIDKERLDLTERRAVEYWMKRWGVTRDQLTAAHRKVGRLTKDIAELVETWRLKPLVKALQALRGVQLITAVILAAMYLLTMYQKIFFGPLDKPANRAPNVRDVHGRETWVFGIVVVAALFMGVFPQTFLSRSEKSVDAFMKGYRDHLEDARHALVFLSLVCERRRPAPAGAPICPRPRRR